MPTKACTRVKPTSSTTREDISSSFPTISKIIAELAQNKNDFRLLQTRFKSVVDDMQILSKNIVSIEDRLNERLTSEHLQDSTSNLKPELKKSRYVSAPEISLSPNQSDTEESQVTMPNPVYSKVFSPLDQAKCDDHILEFPPNNNDSHHRNVTPHDVLAALGKDDDVSNSNLGNSQVDTSFFINGKIDRQAANIKGKEMSHHTIIAKKKIQINQSMLFPLEIPCNEMIQELQNERLEDMPLSKKHNKDGQSKFSKPSKKKINITTFSQLNSNSKRKYDKIDQLFPACKALRKRRATAMNKRNASDEAKEKNKTTSKARRTKDKELLEQLKLDSIELKRRDLEVEKGKGRIVELEKRVFELDVDSNKKSKEKLEAKVLELELGEHEAARFVRRLIYHKLHEVRQTSEDYYGTILENEPAFNMFVRYLGKYKFVDKQEKEHFQRLIVKERFVRNEIEFYITNAMKIGLSIPSPLGGGDPPWRTVGHQYMGLLILYPTPPSVLSEMTNAPVTGVVDKYNSRGIVTGWISSADVDKDGLPGYESMKTGTPIPSELFHVVFDSSSILDYQDLEEYELMECLLDDIELGRSLSQSQTKQLKKPKEIGSRLSLDCDQAMVEVRNILDSNDFGRNIESIPSKKMKEINRSEVGGKSKIHSIDDDGNNNAPWLSRPCANMKRSYFTNRQKYEMVLLYLRLIGKYNHTTIANMLQVFPAQLQRWVSNETELKEANPNGKTLSKKRKVKLDDRCPE